MKILHTSDLHINSALDTHLAADKVRQRKAELLGTFERMVEEAVSVGVRAFIIAGDLADSDRISRPLAERILNIIERAPSIDFLYLPGNHEGDALLVSGLALPRNLKLFDAGWTYFNYGDVRISGRSLLSSDMFDTLSLSDSTKNIVVLHGGIGGRSSEEVIGLKDAAGRGIDYMALGHYHSYSVYDIGDGASAVYCGTPEGRGFDETGDKGFVLIDTDPGYVRHRFVPFAKRRLHILKVDIKGTARRIDIEDRVETALANIPHTDMVRAELVGERSPELFADLNSIKLRFGERFFHFELKDSTRLRIDSEAYKHDKSLKGEFIRLVLSKEDISERDKDLIIRAGLSALMGEGTDTWEAI